MQFLRGLGFEAEAAADGAEGVAAWRRLQPALVWMDLRMPVLDGYEACRNICDLAAAAGQPRPLVVAITANSLEGGRMLGEAAGFSAYAAKPFRTSELCLIMERLLDVTFEEAPKEPAPLSPQSDCGAGFALLDPVTCRDLLRAATLADYEAAQAIIQRLATTQLALAGALQEQLDAYRFDRIESMLNDGAAASAAAGENPDGSLTSSSSATLLKT